MVGHRSERYAPFGWAAARLDDVLSWPGARLGARWRRCSPRSSAARRRATLRVVRRDGAAHPSPNAGRIEAAFAGALGVRLGGPLAYGGRVEDRPALGDGRAPEADDVDRAIRLSHAVGVAAALLARRRARRSCEGRR